MSITQFGMEMTRLVAGPKCRHGDHDDFGISATNRLLLWSDCNLIEGQKAYRRCLVLGGIAEAFRRHGTRPHGWKQLCARDRQPQGGRRNCSATRGLRPGPLCACAFERHPGRPGSGRGGTHRVHVSCFSRVSSSGASKLQSAAILTHTGSASLGLRLEQLGPIVSCREYSTGVGLTASDGHPRRSAAEAGFA
jgi:hypothetical protein